MHNELEEPAILTYERDELMVRSVFTAVVSVE